MLGWHGICVLWMKGVMEDVHFLYCESLLVMEGNY